MNAKSQDADPRYRSLLYKAVRRGNVDLIVTTSAMVSERWPDQKASLKDRAAVITFQDTQF